MCACTGRCPSSSRAIRPMRAAPAVCELLGPIKMCIRDSPESIDAPVDAGQVVGFVRVLLGETVVAKLNVVAASAVPLPGFIEGFFRIINAWR